MTRLFIATLGTVVLAVGCSSGDLANAPVPDPSEGADAVTAAPAPQASAQQAPARQAPARQAPAPAAPRYHEVSVPAGTALGLRLTSTVASDASQIEDVVRAVLRQDLALGYGAVLPAGTQLIGHVTDADRSGRVSGRARVAFRFTSLRFDGDNHDMRTDVIERVANATKSEDATKVGIGAGAGAAIGAILGGGSGAAKGAAIGGAAGTGVVLATRGEEVRLEPGDLVEARLAAPLAFHVLAR